MAVRRRVGAGRELETGFSSNGGDEPGLGGQTLAGEAVRSKPFPLAGLRTLLKRAGRSPFSLRGPYAYCLPHTATLPPLRSL